MQGAPLWPYLVSDMYYFGYSYGLKMLKLQGPINTFGLVYFGLFMTVIFIQNYCWMS